jgi:hypothetical protein
VTEPTPASLSADSPTNAAVSELIRESTRVGITWEIRRGTIATDNVGVLMDGDDVTVRAESLIGRPYSGQRVTILDVTGGANYIIGALGPRPSFSAYRSAAFNFAVSTWLQIGWDTVEWDDGFVTPASANIPIPATGLYSFNAQIVFAGASNTTTRSISLNKNSGGVQSTGVIVQSNRPASSTAGDGTAVHIEKKTMLDGGDTIQVYGFSRSAVAGETGVNRTYISLVLLN